MKKQLYAAAISGNVEFLREARTKDVESAAAAYSDADFLCLTSHGNNIIHVATEHGHLDFIVKALQSFTKVADRRKLICGTNSDGDTPLHFAAKRRTPKIAQHLTEREMEMEASRSRNPWTWSWRVQNKDGNTPLHVALLNGGRSIQVAAYLLEVGPEVATFTNRRQRAPLHLAVTYDNQGTEMSTVKVMNTLNGQGAALTCRTNLFGEDLHLHLHSLSLSVISSLLEKNSEVCCLRDADGMTPLLRAAINCNVPAVEAIIKDCPESIEICDPTGKKLLHHIRLPNIFEARKLLDHPEISMFHINQQDDDGSTPMHIAIENRDFGLVKAMAECNSNFAIKNEKGVSAQTLLDQFAINNKHDVAAATQAYSKSNNLGTILGRENEIELIKEELLSKELYEAAKNEEWESLKKRLEEGVNDNLFLSRLPDGSNIMHIAVEGFPINFSFDYVEDCPDEPSTCPKELFIVSALKKFPLLSSQTNHHGQTPLHLAMSRETLRPNGMLFNYIKEHFRHIKESTTHGSCFLLPPWKAKTAQGDTLLHLALYYSRFEFAKYLIELDAESVEEVNNRKETPFHLLCLNMSDDGDLSRSSSDGKLDEFNKMVDLLLQNNVSVAYSRDAEGFTPLLRAVCGNHLGVAARILFHCPQSIRHYDYQGRNIFHWLGSHSEKDRRMQELCKMVPQMRVLMNSIDDDGNTPLHLAFKNEAFGTAKFLVQDFDDKFIERGHLDYDMRTIHDTLDEAHNVPRWFTNFMESKLLTFGGQFVWSNTRSYYGVRKTDIKEYVNSLGVVAALLATLTFTAAFTVPRGYDEVAGTANLILKVAFQVFIVSDVVGMCCSMMVLFCLLWILTAYHDHKIEELVLVDTTIMLLQLSFYATLVTFMTGVYATTSHDFLWLAISTCVLCTAIILLMRRRLILSFMWKFLATSFIILPQVCHVAIKVIVEYFRS